MSQVAKSREQPDFLVDRSKGSLVNTNLKKKMAYKKQRNILRDAQSSTSKIIDLENAFNLLLHSVKSDHDK